ncbi:PREDICTED: uncharacterized protein LOC108562433 isoform X2 [Nicrophorus vespilloides]|uniref:Uncharacterized protein LOC108562433 isoform X2 n=1 Tax=Nicrophorus vespilloides TaxID=110193 RepID=A0ABM1MNV3_NICVS|nr:PREDICTED: uncharacterized protein LOC108562433 isoform X2 [Nicrophorus vespilloides]
MKVYNTISVHLDGKFHIPGDSVQAGFNDMQLYPSKTQVSEMLQCAKQVGRRNGTSFLTFGEFCIYVREMQRTKTIRKLPTQRANNKNAISNCEVFLGGSCNPTTWRTDTAIPELKKHGITYYNPQVSMWAPELVAKEHDAKQKASLLLYVVDSQTRSVAGMIEVSYLVAAGRCVVLVTHPYREGQSIMDEPITNQEYEDLVSGQTSLLALVKSQGIKVHNNLTTALQCTTHILRNATINNGMSAEEQITHKLRTLKDAFDSVDADGNGEISLGNVINAYYRLTNRMIDVSQLLSYLGVGQCDDSARTRISFEQFCALVAEFSADGCESFASSDGWFGNQRRRNQAGNTNGRIKAEQQHHNQWLAQVYLGGSCETRNGWRESVIPLLKKHGVTYYNPAIREFDGISNLNESAVLHRKKNMDKSKVLLFNITEDTRSLTTMILAAHYIGLDRNVVLCVQQLPIDGLEIKGEALSKQAIKDYNRGRVYLSDLAKRKQVPVFEDINEAIKCAIDRSR